MVLEKQHCSNEILRLGGGGGLGHLFEAERLFEKIRYVGIVFI